MKYYKQHNQKQFLRLLLLLLVAGTGVLFNSCYPGAALTPANLDLVATFHKAGADFSTKMTYAMPDSIARVDKDGNPVFDPGQYDQQIISRIKANLNQMGYTEEQDPANADVLVTAFITTTTWASGGCNYWWYGWWWPYPGYCYPVVYTYSTGSLLISMADPQAQGGSDALWIAGINGILEDTGTGILTRLNTNIDQAFSQSPYLGDGK